ncbi:MAG: FMN-binding glutamate synthase family protein [Flavobacteriales bacterium]|nr:FMN-binding glutamate synthase family protein [Flavobacteriales bacterium]MBK6945211.1 FMN-binding glutamate synthase family protein [Flavobacteriales bacterium]MBK7239560.1 FMN-binding glutamate synthase family protein [Flavobacteriales bacterium]MBK9535233.1 FMN-binding glutamate synthase family protein [Flavobacteriales bacterium]MBP9137792.1 FMN-binding glutamate synthase family protein [Flavobacteriales bacterium]
MRNVFLVSATAIILLIGTIGYFHPNVLWLFIIVGPLYLLGLYDCIQPRHAILRNFPVIGHLRYMLEAISPEIQQYFIELNTEGKPFSRKQRELAYRRGKNVDDTTPFGTQLELNTDDYEGLRHSIFPAHVMKEAPRVHIGGEACKLPYNASLFNISAMSFGSLSSNAILALNSGAKKGGFYHNTGEGGLSPYHLEPGGDVCWQIGTGYFGCRTKDGKFDPQLFATKSAHVQVRMIELKLSQGAKPGHGGVLPAIKNTPEIAAIRHIEPHTMVLSPPGHSAFNSAQGLLEFVDTLRTLSGGKPVGFKLCIGRTEEFVDICKAMANGAPIPDFITVDGAEGGTGAAPLEFNDSVGMPLVPALIFVHTTLLQYKVRSKVKVIASGKVLSAASLLKMLGLGADICNSARGFLFSLGCIQALRCNTNACPTGITTQDKMLVKGLVVSDKSERVYHFHRNTLRGVMELLAACGKHSIDEIGMDMFMRGDEFTTLQNKYFPNSLDTDRWCDLVPSNAPEEVRATV